MVKGKIADPVCPTPAIQPTAPVSSHFGMTLLEWLTRMGYIRPSSTPANETATAFSMSEGTRQIVTSNLPS